MSGHILCGYWVVYFYGSLVLFPYLFIRSGHFVLCFCGFCFFIHFGILGSSMLRSVSSSIPIIWIVLATVATDMVFVPFLPVLRDLCRK